MTLSGYNHNPGSGSDNNASVLDRVTQDWQENVVTYNTFPTSSTDIEQNIPVTTTTNEDEIVI